MIRINLLKIFVLIIIFFTVVVGKNNEPIVFRQKDVKYDEFRIKKFKAEIIEGVLFDSDWNICEGSELTPGVVDNSIWEITTSSFILSEGKHPYRNRNPMLGSTWTTSKGRNISEWIEARFVEKYDLYRIYFCNGNLDAKTIKEQKEMYEDYGRVKEATVIFSDGSEQKIRCHDQTMLPQAFYLGHKTDSIKIVITDVYPGKKYRSVSMTALVIERKLKYEELPYELKIKMKKNRL